MTPESPQSFSIIIQIAYLISSILFIIGIKRLSSPATARSGNQLAAVGMLIAVVVTLLDRHIVSYWIILGGIVVGTIAGLVSAYSVKMTDMPQMVAIFNGMGGGAAALVGVSELVHHISSGDPVSLKTVVIILLGACIGMVTFSGSFIAFAKLQGMIASRTGNIGVLRFLSAILAIAVIVLFLGVTIAPAKLLFIAYLCAAFLFGIFIVLPIGGADMPVVISLLNSCTGLSVALAGFVLSNNVLIISGTLVGASGTILTLLMCKAMNRALINVIFGSFGAALPSGAASSGNGKIGDGTIKDISVEDAGILLGYARKVIIVPGYGLAVAQAQHGVRELADVLEKRGIEVKYAIHPVAGRMPGHMNVLLAEANVPYSQLFDMDDINPEFSRTDVALVIGANDVVNPAARTSPDSPIAGMPILDVDNSANVIVIKRGMSHGFAGIENELFYNPKTSMLFGDAKDALAKLVSAVKQV